MDLDLLKQWPILVLVIVIVGPLLKVIQALYERLLTEAITPRDKRITEQKDQIVALADAFDRLADVLEPYVDPQRAPNLRRKDGPR